MTEWLREGKALVQPVNDSDPYSIADLAPTGGAETRDQLPAGEVLDAEVARRVFGFWQDTDGDWWGKHPLTEGAKAHASCAVPSMIYGPSYRYTSLPFFSTKIEAAWQIIEKASQLGYHARVTSPFMRGELYFAGFTPHGVSGWNGRPDYVGSGETAPLAICRAALSLASTHPAAAADTR